jgi:tetratricopeptide (TPR) repeat protein
VLNAAARVENWRGENEKAIQYAFDAQEIEPENATTLAILAEIYTDEGNPPVAQDYLDQALAIDPENVMALRNQAYLHEQQGDYEEAIAAYDAAIAAAPHRFDLYIEKGRQYRVGLLDFEQANAAYRQAVEAYEAPVTLDALGDGLYNAGDYLGAVETLRDAVELDPEYGPALVHLGMAYYARRNYEDAVVNLEKGLAILGDAARIEQVYTAGLAHIYKAPTECDKAEPWLRKALEMNPDASPASEGLRICANSPAP